VEGDEGHIEIFFSHDAARKNLQLLEICFYLLAKSFRLFENLSLLEKAGRQLLEISESLSWGKKIQACR
jgi:hypothetical protein